MQVTCPCCYARFSIEAALNDDAARQAISTALKLPAPIGDLILRYTALFRPPKRALSWDRVAKLLAELLEPIQAGKISRHGRTWVAPSDFWQRALTDMLDRKDKLQLPLKSHGYLFEIITAYSSKDEARAERATEDQRRHAPVQRDESGPKRLADHLQKLKGSVKP